LNFDTVKCGGWLTNILEKLNIFIYQSQVKTMPTDCLHLQYKV